MFQRTSLLAAVGLIALAGAALAGPTPETWAAGTIARVDLETRALVIAQGAHEMTFVVDEHARVARGRKRIPASDLSGNVGKHVKVRYRSGPGGRVADTVIVSDPSPPERYAE